MSRGKNRRKKRIRIGGKIEVRMGGIIGVRREARTRERK